MHMTARRSLLVLLPFLLAAEPLTRPTASTITLDGRARTLAEAAREIARQANIPIDIERADGERRITLPLNNVPFWDAIDQLARAADHRLAIGPQGQSVSLLRGPQRPVPISVSGPFRFIARN